MARFLAWLDRQPLHGGLDEMGAAERLLAERAKDPLFRGESFPAISAHGPNSALPHYRSTPASNRPLTGGTLYLVDLGGQYLDATTDITRTVALGEPTAEMRERFTLVLRGTSRLPPPSSRRAPAAPSSTRWPACRSGRAGLDFDHGTGHGVGAYLCVHEGPPRISKRAGSVALKPGMIVSNEPGYYKLDAYGIRIENLVTSRASEAGGRRARAAGLPDAHALPDRPAADRRRPPHARRAGLGRRLPRARRGRAGRARGRGVRLAGRGSARRSSDGRGRPLHRGRHARVPAH